MMALLALLLSFAGHVQADEVATGRFFVRQEGDRVRAAVAIEIERGWHLYHGPTAAEMGPEDAIGKPTTLAFEGAPVEWGALRFPEPQREEQDLGFGEPTWIFVHEGPLVLHVEGTAAPDADLSGLVALVDGLVCSEETGLCIPYREELKPEGPGPDALFAIADVPTPKAHSPPAFPSAPAQSFAVPGTSGSPGASFPGERDEAKAHATLWARQVGDELQVAIAIEIAAHWHLYHGPSQEDVGPDSFATPTTVALSVEGAEVRWGPLVFPAPERIESDLGEDAPSITFEHAGTLLIRARGAASGSAVGLAERVRALVSGQTCSTETGLCIQYAEELAAAGAGPDALFAAFVDPAFARIDGSAAGSTPGVSSAPTDRVWEPVEESGDSSLWLFLLAAVGWGLFTLLMPCTYPMIPITISFFTKQATQREKSAAPLALAYGAGIVAIFVLIGIVVGPVIIRFATHPVTNLVIGGLFLVFALALFGAIELRPPAFLMNAAGKASSKGGYVGVFLMGVTLVVTSFTCTAPFVGSLLSLGASQGGVGRIALGMAVFGLTMALPFVLLSLLPGKLKSIPKSGEWMHVLKVFLGFVEVAAALKFISNTDLVWQWQVLSRELFLSLWTAIFFAAALFLFGMLRLEGESEAGVGPKRMLGGLASLLFAAYCAYGALGNSLDGVMTAIAPPYSNRTAVLEGARGGGARASHTIVKDDYEAARALAVREGKGLLVNFTGYT